MTDVANLCLRIVNEIHIEFTGASRMEELYGIHDIQ